MAGGRHMRRDSVPRGRSQAHEPSEARRAVVEPNAPRRRGAALARVVGLLMYLAGVALFLGPSVYGWVVQRNATQAATAALAQDGSAAQAGEASSAPSDVSAAAAPASTSDPASPSAAAPASTSGSPAVPKRTKDGDAAYAYLRDYNARVVAGTAGPTEDPWNGDAASSPLASVGLADQVMGTIAIPRLGETIPIYLGADSEHLSRGSAVVNGTSVPLGEVGSNSVIAAHRGQWNGLPMFRDIEDLQLGDLVTIETPWDTLVYKAVEFKVIAPIDTDAVRPQAGRDLVTLLTCHPYGHNYQRYLVICERTDAPAAEADDSLARAIVRPALSVLEPSDSQELVVERWLRLAGLLVVLVVPVVFAVRALARRRRRE